MNSSATVNWLATNFWFDTNFARLYDKVYHPHVSSDYLSANTINLSKHTCFGTTIVGLLEGYMSVDR